MKKVLVFLLLIIIPFNVFALSDKYEDKVSDITGSEVQEGKINLYLFHGKECPHCREEKEWLKAIQKKYKNYLKIEMFEVWHDDDNAEVMNKVRDELSIKSEGVPLTVIGDEHFVGFSEAISSRMENTIKNYIDLKNSNEINIPILGNIDMKKVSIPLVAVILGFIDGFNPCAMWILLFLINMLFNVKSKKKRWVLGLTFLSVSALVYFLSMLGINFILSVSAINVIKYLVGIFIFCAGLYNFKKYLDIRNEEAGCSVVDDKKRKKLINKMKNIINSKSFILSLFGIITLAISVNLIELACSLGFPLIFTELLSINNVEGLSRILYLLLYILFYMLDDMIVFIISMVTLEMTGITNKYNKMCTLVSSIIMVIMGVLLLFKPEWLMMNF